MEISQKDFSELTSLMSNMTKTLKNFDDRLNEIENNVADIGETVTVELPKVIAEQVGEAVDTAVAENTAAESNAEVVTDEAATSGEEEVCPNCGNTPCTCEETVVAEEGTAPVAEGQEFCGDNASFEEFSEQVTTTIENLAQIANDISERVNKMFIKVFSEGDDLINDVTDGEEDVQKVETALKEDNKEFVTEEDPQITEETPNVEAKVVVEAPVAAPAVVDAVEEKKQFSKRYEQVKGIFNL